MTRDTDHERATEPLSPPVLYILLALADRRRHGYGIMQEVEERSDGRIRLLPGSLYATIRRMLAAGLVEEVDAPPAAEDVDPRRRYYAITAPGREAAEAELRRMATVMELARDKRLAPLRAPGDGVDP